MFEGVTAGGVEEFLRAVLERAGELARVPIDEKQILFMFVPLLVTLFLIELYFAKYRNEELGWNTAVGNSLVLFFVGMNLLGHLYGQGRLFVMEADAMARSVVALFVVFESIFLIAMNFYHLMPEKISYGISSALPVNLLGVLSILLVYSRVPFDFVTAAASLFLVIVLILIVIFVKSLEAPAIESVEEVGKVPQPGH